MDILQPALKIVQFPHPSLRHKARPLTGIDAKIHHVAAAMIELMYDFSGLGLAAPQVGLPFQMFVANEGDPEQGPKEGVYINPVIVEKKGGLVEAEEGCLSFPQLFLKVRRARTVFVQAYNLQGQLVEKEVSDLEARVWQHETDHLHGDLFIDKISPIGKLASRTALGKFEREYHKLQERGEIPSDAEIEKRLTELEKLA